MRIFVSGGRGFLGSHLIKYLVNKGHSVDAPNSKEIDLTDQRSLTKLSSVKYDQIFHLAAWTQAGDFCLKHPGKQWIINQRINTNVLEWWSSSQPQAKLVAIGTSCCYEPGSPHKEENFMRGDPTESLYTYAMTKRMLYQGLRAISAQFGLNYLFVVPSTLYGADYHLDGRQMHFIFDLIRKILLGVKNAHSVELWGDGSQVRELIHVNDFVSALMQLNELKDRDIINIGGGKGHTIKEFASIICKILGYDAQKIQYDLSKYVGAKEKVLDTTKLHTTLPNFKLTPLEDGLTETVAWFKANFNQ